MNDPSLDALGDCLEGIVPSSIATVDPDGVPNISLISQVHYVDPERVALSYQFFNKTRSNLLATGRAVVGMIDPVTMTEYRLALRYEETRTSGPLFESMKAKLAGIASHTGMAEVFRLLGADVFRVERIGSVPGPRLSPAAPPRNLLAATRRTCVEIAAATDLGELFDRTLACLDRHFGIDHSMLLLVDGSGDRLYTVASRGYDRSGIGSELALGKGVVGVAARERVPIRIGHMTADTDYGTAIRDQALRHGLTWEEATEIPFPGLASPESQMAVPLVGVDGTAGVLFAESREPLRFRQEDEDALALVADRLAALIPVVQQDDTRRAGGRRGAGGGDGADRRPALRGRRQRVSRPRLPDQGGRRGDLLEAGARAPGSRPGRVHQSRAAARPGAAPARARREPRGAAAAVAAAAARTVEPDPHREGGAGPAAPRRAGAADPRGDGRRRQPRLANI